MAKLEDSVLIARLAALVRGNSRIQRRVWSLLTTFSVFVIVYFGIDVHGVMRGPVDVNWTRMDMPFAFRTLIYFWLVYTICFALLPISAWVMFALCNIISLGALRSFLILFIVAYFAGGVMFRQWVYGLDATIKSYEIVLTQAAEKEELYAVLQDIGDNCIVLWRGGEQRVWIPPEMRDRRGDAIRRLEERGFQLQKSSDRGELHGTR